MTTECEAVGLWKSGNEFLPFHPSASHVRPDYRDGWNACFEAAKAQKQWMPIETAPRDGTEILAWRDDCGAFMAKWTCVNELRTTSDKDRDEYDEETLFSEDWFGGDSEGNFRADGSEAPTQWQPLPAPPETKA